MNARAFKPAEATSTTTLRTLPCPSQGMYYGQNVAAHNGLTEHPVPFNRIKHKHACPSLGDKRLNGVSSKFPRTHALSNLPNFELHDQSPLSR
jgi:hypothetical protein